MSAIQALGYAVAQTGGGCTALVKDDGSYQTMITTQNGCEAPTSWADAVTVGRYRLDDGEQEGECVDYASLAIAINVLHPSTR